jgi:signal transduction histidine kinase/ActR/RegA family two-component response regulator
LLGAIKRSIRNKVIVLTLAATLAGMLASAGALLTYEIGEHRRSGVADALTQASILARSAAPALRFEDPVAAAADLAVLESLERVLVGAIYDVEGAPFATYRRAGSDAEVPAAAVQEGPRISGTMLTVSYPVLENGERLGSVYLQTHFDLQQRLLDYLFILAAAMLGSLAVASVVSLWLQRGVTGPILAVADAARNVIRGRDFTLRAPKRTEDEVSVLVDAFNAMLGEVDQRTAALESSNRALQHESEERAKAEAALRLADRNKDEFLATLAHELRNPLASMVNAASLMGSAREETITQRARDIVERQLKHLVRLVDDLLDISRITSGKLSVHKVSLELAEVVRTAVDTVKPLIEKRGHELAISLPQRPIHLRGDPVRLAQVLSNLLNNAAQYTPPGGHIALSASVSANNVQIVVSDDGIGISPEGFSRIFELFARGDEANRSGTGLGVGLALARRLTELHGGALHAQSSGPGLGSRFIVELPVMAALASERSLEPVDKGQDASGRYRILVVDDNVDYATSLALLLRGIGHQVHVEHDAASAMIAARELRPHVAILDIGLPVMNGYELARQLRLAPANAHIALIAVSGWGEPQDRQNARDAGFDLHLVKPVSFEKIQSAVVALVPQRQSETASSA